MEKGILFLKTYLLIVFILLPVVIIFFKNFKCADEIESQLLNKKVESRENSDMQNF